MSIGGGGKSGVGIRLFVQGGEVVKAAFNDVADSGKKMWAQIALGEKAANPAIVALSRASGEAQGAVQGLASRAGGAANVLGAFGVAGVGVGAAMGAAVLAIHGMRNALQFADDLDAMSTKLGTSAEMLQELTYAAHENDISTESLTGNLAALNAALGAYKTGVGDTRVKKAFEALGLTREDVAFARSGADLLPLIADRIAALQSTAARVKIAKALGLEDMVPLLEKGGAEIDRLRAAAQGLGFIMSDELAVRAADANRELERMGEVAGGVLKIGLADAGSNVTDFIGQLQELLVGLKDIEGFDQRISTMRGMKEYLDRVAASMPLGKTFTYLPRAVLGTMLNVMAPTEYGTGAAEERGQIERDFAAAQTAGTGGDGGGGGGGGGGRSKAKPADSYTGKLPPGLLEAIADKRLTEAEARRLFAPVSEGDTFVIINALGEPLKGETPEQKADRERAVLTSDPLPAADQNPSLRDGLNVVRGPFGGLMSPEDKESWARDIGDATADGVDAALHGDFWGWFKQQLYRNALEGLSDGIADAFKSADFGGFGGGGGGFWGSLISGAGSMFGFGGGGASSVAAHAGSSAMTFGGGRAAGGSMGDGMWYRAGEHGQTELAMVGAGGHVANHDQTQRMLRDMMGGGGPGGASGARAPVVNFTFAPVINAQGAGPREIDALKGELATMRREMPGEVVAVVSDAIARRQIG